jgi:U4/U6.U5 tri-snRNP-associated protein 3
MSDTERPCDRFRERDSRREPREDRTREPGGAPSDRRNRSRSPRRGGGQRGDNRYRSRSPVRKDDRERDGAREPRGRGRGGRDRDQDSHRRDAPRGPRGGGAAPPSGPRKSDFAPRGGPVKPPSAPRDAVKKEETPDVEMSEDAQKPEDMDDDTWEMQKMMGFAGFKSTKNRKVPGNDKNYGVRKDKTMEARQYMNRQGGFNRPLSPSRG